MNINPHTVLKGKNLLVDEGIIYKIRKLGMFVKTGAVEKILRREAFTYVAITFGLTIILRIPAFFELIIPHSIIERLISVLSVLDLWVMGCLIFLILY